MISGGTKVPDEESLSSSHKLERAAPSSRFLDFFLTHKLGCVDDCQRTWNQASCHHHWIRFSLALSCSMILVSKAAQCCPI